MAASHLRNGALALGVLGAVVLYLGTENEVLSHLSYYGVVVGAGVGAWVGVARTPRGQRLVPALIAAGVSLSSAGEVLWAVADAKGKGTEVSLADPFWFISYVALCAALWVAIKRSRPTHAESPGADLNLTLDVVTVVFVSLLIFWSLTIDTIVADGSVTPFVRAVWASYPVADAVLLALVLRVAVSRYSRAGIDAWFVAGVCFWLAADIAYLGAPDHSGATTLGDAGWMIAPVLMARAAWPSALPQEAASAPSPRPRVGQLAIAVTPLLVPPGLELIADLRGQDDKPLQLFVGTTVLVVLALVRTARLLRSEDRALNQVETALREVEAARDAALEASQAKTLFVANVSHEIRTPLTTMLASGEMLEDESFNEAQRTLLVAKLNRSGELLKSLVEALLDFSRIQAGELRLSSTPFDLRAMVTDLDEVYRSRAAAADISCECSLEPDVPHTVVGDPARVFQILTNLLDNALKFTHEGEVRLLVRSAAPGPAGAAGELEFVVSDTGIGLKAEDQVKIFESFHQVDGSTTRHYGGNGLGLAICKELIELMNGSITVNSQLGAGSTFAARLALVPASIDPQPCPEVTLRVGLVGSTSGAQTAMAVSTAPCGVSEHPTSAPGRPPDRTPL